MLEGYCRICGDFSRLTVDHIPPKACGNALPVEVEFFHKKKTIQRGLSAKTICGKCNNERLGAMYDNELVRIYREMDLYYQTSLYLGSRFVRLNVDTVSLVKSAIGHILAANFSDKIKLQRLLSEPLSDEGIFDEYRDYFLGRSNQLENFDVYYWYYPFKNIKLIPYYGFVPDYFGTGNYPVFGTLFKFFPIALFFLHKPSSKSLLKFPTIPTDHQLPFLQVDMRREVHELWPDRPDDKMIVLLNQESDVKARAKATRGNAKT